MVAVLYLILAVGAAGMMPWVWGANLTGTALAFALGREPQRLRARHLRVGLWVVGFIAGPVAHPEHFMMLGPDRLPEILVSARVYALGFPILEGLLAGLYWSGWAGRH